MASSCRAGIVLYTSTSLTGPRPTWNDDGLVIQWDEASG
jgi:hypothetical protein